MPNQLTIAGSLQIVTMLVAQSLTVHLSDETCSWPQGHRHSYTHNNCGTSHLRSIQSHCKLYSEVNSLFDGRGNGQLVKGHVSLEVANIVTVDYLPSKLHADYRKKEVKDYLNEVRGMNYVEVLQVFLIPTLQIHFCHMAHM